MRKAYDIAVIGAGPIGSYTAYQLADKGFSVCLFEQKQHIGEKVVCAGIVSKEAFRRYDLPSESILARINALTFISPSGKRLEYEPQDIFAYTVSRSVFDNGLLKLARRVGVDIFMGQRVIDIKESANDYTIVCNKHKYSAKAVVIATGVDYRLHKKLNIGSPPAFLYGYHIETQLACPESTIQLYLGQKFTPGSFYWIAPAGKDRARIGAIMKHRDDTWFERVIQERKHIPFRHLGKGELRMKLISYGPVQKSVKDRILMVGEAAGQVKTSTGGGIFFGLLCSEIAVEKLADTLKHRGSLTDYEIAWRSALVSELDIGKLMRDIAEKMTDSGIEGLFNFVKGNRFWVQLLMKRISFDFHSNLIYFCLKSFNAISKLPKL